MNDDIRQAIGLIRHQIISPVLVEGERAQKAYFRKMALVEFQIPGAGTKRFSVHTMKSWLKAYRKSGFSGLLPKVRADRGQIRKIDDALSKKIIDFRGELLHLSVAKFYRRAKAAGVLGEPPICELTLRRFLIAHNLFDDQEKKTARKRYEMSRFGELWVGDFMHGPIVLDGGRMRKAILLAIIDDFTRMIVGFRWSPIENTLPIELVFKEAVLKYGKPDRLYTDNGPSFSSSYLRSVCAHLGVGLVHSKPYDSPSRGKIERFFRTVRESFLSDFTGKTMKELEMQFQTWLRDDYLHKKHAGIDCKPIERYQRSLMDYPRERVSEDLLEELFLVRSQRRVKKDATLSFQNLIYECPPKYIGEIVEIRFKQDRPRELFLYEGDTRICPLKACDARLNGKTYKPKNRDTTINYQESEK